MYDPWKDDGGILTRSGGVSIFDPKEEQIVLFDIYVALTRTARYNGHTEEFYSVAQHSVNLANWIDQDDLRVHALLHDAAEAYMGDLVSPIKKYCYLKNPKNGLLERFDAVESRLLDTIYRALGLNPVGRPDLTAFERTFIDRDLQSSGSGLSWLDQLRSAGVAG